MVGVHDEDDIDRSGRFVRSAPANTAVRLAKSSPLARAVRCAAIDGSISTAYTFGAAADFANRVAAARPDVGHRLPLLQLQGVDDAGWHLRAVAAGDHRRT